MDDGHDFRHMRGKAEGWSIPARSVVLRQRGSAMPVKVNMMRVPAAARTALLAVKSRCSRTRPPPAAAVGWIAIMSLAAPALAEDPSVPLAPPASASPSEFSWAGTYVGFNIGQAWNGLELQASSFGSESPLSPSQQGALIGGFQSGHNWQFGHMVLGFEGDTEFSGQHTTVTIGTPFGLLQAGDAFKAKTVFASSTRARVGWAADRLMVYGTGGLATALVDISASYGARGPGSPTLKIDRNNKFRFGYTVGAGIGYAMSERASLGLEYRYADLGRRNYDLGAPAKVGDLRLTSSIVTARLNIRIK